MKSRLALVFLFLLSTFELSAQSAIREQINAERRDLSLTGEESLNKARALDFIRRDSTYYVGYLYEGAYRIARATDILGFKYAAEPLLKALNLIERDYDRELRTRTSDIYVYIRVQTLQRDYGYIVDFLQRSYQNIERADLAMTVLRRYRNRNLQFEFPVEAYNTMAWLHHRNRMYTAMRFSFLKNSVKENNTIAMLYLDSALMKIQEDAAINIGFFDASWIQAQQYSVYHYKAILFTYDMQIDSADFYYGLLLQAGYYSSNNFGNYCYVKGDFVQSEEFYAEAESRDDRIEKQTREYYYMRGILDVYKARPDLADSLLQNVLNEQGATPGFGWHSIGLSRAKLYSGQTAESLMAIQKASRFQELHIGTTWGQEQYDLCVSAFNYLGQLRLKQEYFFEHDEWWFWFNPIHLWNWIKLSIEVHEQKLLLAGLLAANPEREEVVYSLFSSENLLGFDEVWSIIDGYGNEYFIELYKKKLKADQRKPIHMYFRYFIGRLYLNEGNEEEAIRWLRQVIDDPQINMEHARLLHARTCEAMALATDGSNRDEWTMRMYRIYPQLLPYSDLEMRMRKQVTGATDTDQGEDLIEALDDCNIDWTDDINAPLASIRLEKLEGGLNVSYTVSSIGIENAFHVNQDEEDDGGKLLAYRLFNISKKQLGEPEKELKTIVRKTKQASMDSL